MSGRHVVIGNITRTDPKDVARLAEAGVSTVHEALDRRGFAGTELRPNQADVRIAGTAVTVSSHPGDNLMIHAAVETCRPGDILVVTTTSPSTDGMFGELLATSLAARGVIGLVTAAGIRDSAELRAMGFHVWAHAVSAQGTVKASPGSVNVPVTLGGVQISPGDVVVADDDGVVVVPREEAEQTAARAEERIAKEAATRDVLRSGELGVDYYGLRARLAELGVDYADQA
ncbi:4-carboxy-4-hydroxy-2-oxoadipate aldolase/oxaloacetate decarboxylase [Streptomyces turgidiscabies]|uniref:Putative 4-hydroxy-4-methyl-2-oxoglutarate aldolase n=1 Tax=Streptomyces turgidiscabies (strain Car8) TaxID=698760 RepID=L7EWF2_STRT8|nr:MULTISPECIES: 4-carboxy-4-hydroxy-2-oxoadipate aldolase/oxaloacetate decarboxylase [Streptomyces]ELP63194.1 putative 4-carboxy-4-hydroxy-2-oxoadipate aldolase/oxaloacetate decarboxylase [Streptomyces turgidiscabies Car8]MDX3499683.1 4-carboxy-4-hydroxy-2-oxoadipate aldolase/oxaloacetate decarboxylase [Streptomyces turgidiscabies]GAQ73371.1 4-hydroxy-4-methyl-2-oxoglutarate aldolase [Streptomyces turgidiscabies]